MVLALKYAQNPILLNLVFLCSKSITCMIHCQVVRQLEKMIKLDNSPQLFRQLLLVAIFEAFYLQ